MNARWWQGDAHEVWIEAEILSGDERQEHRRAIIAFVKAEVQKAIREGKTKAETVDNWAAGQNTRGWLCWVSVHRGYLLPHQGPRRPIALLEGRPIPLVERKFHLDSALLDVALHDIRELQWRRSGAANLLPADAQTCLDLAKARYHILRPWKRSMGRWYTTCIRCGCRLEIYPRYNAPSSLSGRAYKRYCCGQEDPQMQHRLEAAIDWLADLYGRRACMRCQATDDLTVDHIIPRSQDGPHTMDNLQILCRSCNSTKGTTHTDYRPFPFTEAPQHPRRPTATADLWGWDSPVWKPGDDDTH